MLIVYQMEFNKIRWFCPWNSDQKCTQNSVTDGGGALGMVGGHGMKVEGVRVWYQNLSKIIKNWYCRKNFKKLWKFTAYLHTLISYNRKK